MMITNIISSSITISGSSSVIVSRVIVMIVIVIVITIIKAMGCIVVLRTALKECEAAAATRSCNSYPKP